MLTIANDPEARELGDAYALLARVYAGPRFTWEESNFPEDNMRTYQCLHDSIRRCSPIGTLQALRIKGSITPTVEQDMQITFDDAFRIVHDYAEQDDAYCQYVIGNVFFWRDDNRIEAAKNYDYATASKFGKTHPTKSTRWFHTRSDCSLTRDNTRRENCKKMHQSGKKMA